jgi:hypothetical protein
MVAAPVQATPQLQVLEMKARFNYLVAFRKQKDGWRAIPASPLITSADINRRRVLLVIGCRPVIEKLNEVFA